MNKNLPNQHETKRPFLNSQGKKDILILGLAAYVFTSMAMTTAQFIMTRDFRSPLDIHFEFSVKPQIPWTDKVISPVSKKTSFIEKAYAEAGKSAELRPEELDMFSVAEVKAYVKQEAIKQWGHDEWASLEELLTRESGFQTYAMNPSSGACGLFQSLPCNKYGKKGLDLKNQVEWGFSYITDRYTLPSKALAFHNKNNWY